MLCTTRSQSAFLLALILALIFVSASFAAGDVKIFGYETPAYVDIDRSEYRVNEADGTVSIILVRSGDFRQTTTVDYQTMELEASEGQDYKATGGTITFRPGEGFKQIVLQIIADDAAEPSESFNFELTGGGPNTVLGRAWTTVWIEDAPRAPSQPNIEIASAANGQILLSWESDRACGLERSANPAGGSWEPVPCNPVAEGNRFQVSQPLGGTLYFYRLRAE
ncbi:MAG TPA: Calx-beta domain-containing protein [Verrucomicrobiae bacterium]